MTFTSIQPVFFDMLDALHMLHNAAYIVIFERARLDFSDHLRAQYGPEALDWPYYVARNEINYRAPILRPQRVTVTVAIAKIGRTSLTFQQTIQMDDGTMAAEGQTVIVRVDPETHRPLPWSDSVRERLAKYLLPEATA